MSVLVYLGHPAHFHLFKELIASLQKKSVKVTIAIKSKDVLEQLLKDRGWTYVNVTDQDSTERSAYKNFFSRLRKLSSLIKKERPAILLGSAAELAILGRFHGIQSYIFFEDDFEVVPKFARIAGPLATKLVCPDCCSAWKWNHKKIGYNSYHELAYLHPNHFTPDPEKVRQIFKPGKNFILRFAQLTAYHDVGKSGITTDISQKLIDVLSPHGNVFITSERALEPQFEKYRIQIPPLDIHHALYYADMYIGDSQTMTAEAAVLGTPAIRFNDFVGELSYLEELEKNFDLTYGIRTNHPDQLLRKVAELLSQSDLKGAWSKKRYKMLDECIDLSDFMLKLVAGQINLDKANAH
jgi:hypothetical protein